MNQRLIIGTVTLLAALTVNNLSSPLRGPWPELAAASLGERTYAVRLKHLPVGQLLQSASRDLAGNFTFSSNLSFQLAHGQPVRVQEHKTFAGRPPFELLSAQQTDTQAAATNSVSLEREPSADADSTYTTTIKRGRDTHNQTLSLTHRLSDYLAVEHWLPGAPLNQPTSFTSLDLDSLSLKRDVWTLLGVTEAGYEVTKSSPLDATRLLLNTKLQPIKFSMAGTFEIEAIDPSALPISPEPVFHSSTYRVPLDEPIENHQTLTGLSLKVTGDSPLVQRWRRSDTDPNATYTTIRSHPLGGRPLVEKDTDRYTREDLSYPVSTPAVQNLAVLAVDPNTTAREQAAQLNSFVHSYIAYDHHSTMQNVLEVIRTKRGDCNEYAELFTTLGRALGWPVRTVIGLAYTDDGGPGFALHAWNEVLIDSAWASFDPTWNQAGVDATHLPLPDDAGSMLMGITSLDTLRFEVLSVRY